MTHAFRTTAGALLLAGTIAGGSAWGQGTPAQSSAPAQPAQAQQGQQLSLPPATEASRREARALGEKLGWDTQVRGIINTLRTAMIVNLAQLNGKSPQDIQGPVDELLMPDFVADSATLSNMIVEAWARAFTAEELRNLRNFYNTPLGEKLLKTIPQLNQIINQNGQLWAQRLFTQVSQKYAEEFGKRGLKMLQETAAPPAATTPQPAAPKP